MVSVSVAATSPTDNFPQMLSSRQRYGSAGTLLPLH